jgi:hypothetical protein
MSTQLVCWTLSPWTNEYNYSGCLQATPCERTSAIQATNLLKSSPISNSVSGRLALKDCDLELALPFFVPFDDAFLDLLDLSLFLAVPSLDFFVTSILDHLGLARDQYNDVGNHSDAKSSRYFFIDASV